MPKVTTFNIHYFFDQYTSAKEKREARENDERQSEKKEQGEKREKSYRNIILINRVPSSVPVVRPTLRLMVTTHWS